MVLTGKPFVFAAGADITEFPKVRDRETAIEGSRAGHDLFGRIRALPYPTVAAINGACLGGGLEIALHCSARTISTSVRHFGFPEVFLGLIPGWGGTQLAPQLIGPAQAVKLIVENPLRQNRMLDGAKAFEWGLADRLLEPVEFVDESIAYALELVEGGLPERAEPDWSELETVLRRARTAVDDAVHGAAPAPYVALDLIEGAGSWTLEEGYRREEEAIADLILSRQAQASLYAFDLVERRAKRGVGIPDAKPRPVQKVGIVGAGLMATQLATLFLRRLEVPIVLRDIEPRASNPRSKPCATDCPRTATTRARPLPRLARHRLDGAGRVRGLRLRARGGLRGARGEEAGLRRARGDRLARVRPRHEHLVAVGDRDGRGPRASRAARRHALLQPGGADAAARADPHARDRRHHARDRLRPLARSWASAACSSRTRPASSSTGC